MRYIFLFLLIFSVAAPADAQLSLDLETGVSFNTKNSVRYPNADPGKADRVNVPEELGTATTFFYRIRTSYTFGEKHTISALYAPLEFQNTGNFSQAVRFGDLSFTPADETTVNYRFNSYRLTYRYRLVYTKNISLGLGLTGKIRDARIAFSTASKSDETTDVGFVPLINFRLEWYWAGPWQWVLSGDALVGKQGRAEDVFTGLAYRLSPPVTLRAGYRILEGGADVEQVYNFSLIHYAAIGIRANL